MKLQLRMLRKRRDLTQDQLAERIDSTLRKISSWEREETQLPLADACKIADVLECSLDELAGRDWPQRSYADPRQGRMNNQYEEMNERGRQRAAESVDDVHANPRNLRDSPEKAPPVQGDPGRQARSA